MMNPQAQEIFDRVTMMSPEELAMKENSYELAFLRARSPYLRPEQREVFKELLKGIDPLSDKKQAEHDKLNALAVAEAKKEADRLAKESKTVKESQNPRND